MVNCSVCNSHKWRSSAQDLPAGLWTLTALQPAQTWTGQQRHQLGSHAQRTLTSTARGAITSRGWKRPASRVQQSAVTSCFPHKPGRSAPALRHKSPVGWTVAAGSVSLEWSMHDGRAVPGGSCAPAAACSRRQSRRDPVHAPKNPRGATHQPHPARWPPGRRRRRCWCWPSGRRRRRCARAATGGRRWSAPAPARMRTRASPAPRPSPAGWGRPAGPPAYCTILGALTEHCRLTM